MLAAGAAIVASFSAAAKATADYGDELRKTLQRTGITVENFAKLKFAAGQAGADFGALSVGLKALAKNSVEAAQGRPVRRPRSHRWSAVKNVDENCVPLTTSSRHRPQIPENERRDAESRISPGIIRPRRHGAYSLVERRKRRH